MSKPVIPDAGDAAGNRVTSAQSARIFNKGDLVLVEQHPSDTAVKRILRVHGYGCQVGAAPERTRPDAGDAGGDCDAGQAGASIESTFPDAGDIRAYRDTGQVAAKPERIVFDTGDAAGNRVTSAQSGGIFKKGDLVLVEQHSIDTAVKRILRVHGYGRQAGAERERVASNVGDAARYGDASQAGAVSERFRTDAGNAVGNRDVGQPCAKVERLYTDAGNAVGNRDAGQAGAVLERIFSDIASLAFKWNKPLAGRILPVKGKKAEDKTDFQDPYLFNTVLRPLP